MCPRLRFPFLPALAGAAWLGAVAPVRAEEGSPAQSDVTKGVLIARMMDQEIARETFEITPDGWKTKGKLDLLGQVKSEYEISERRAQGTTTISFMGKTNGTDIVFEATLTSELFELRLPGKDALKLDLKGKPEPIPYQNLVWIYLEDMGRALVARAKAGSLKIGEDVNLIEVGNKALIPMKARDFKAEPRTHGGKVFPVWTFEITIAGSVEATFVTTESGVPVFLGVPAQKLDCVLEGFEDLKPAAAEPRTIVDSGDWRKLLSKADQGVAIEKKVMAPMRDGLKLAADVYRPDAPKDGKFSTVLIRTPYSRVQAGMLYGNYFARRGYTVVSQDVRGRYDSEGKFEPMRHETEDGSDTLDWIAKQPWSDGKVGMIGGSYLGWVQWAAAKSGNSHLTTIIPQVAPPDPQYNIPYQGGVFTMGSVWWAKVVDQGLGGAKVDWLKALRTLPLTDLDQAFGFKTSFLDDWLTHPPHDPWWDAMCYQKDYSKLDVPALNISGWYDGDQPGAPMNFIAMRKSAKSERARKGQHLIMGPWTHIFNTATRIGDYDFGPDAVVDLDSVTLRWFDHYLKGVDNGVDREDPVLVFTMFENKWHAEKDWPLPQTKWTNLYLAGSGKANKRDGGGTLALAAGESPADRFAYDPNDPPPLNADFDDLSGASVSEDVSKMPDREDVLDFTSPPLASRVEITGPLRAVLSVSTDAKDTDFTVGLMRIEPTGRMLAIAGGIQRLRYRNGYKKEDFAKPGEVSTLTVDLWAQGLRIEAGERLRVEITSTLYPGLARNLNTGEPDATATKMVVAHQTIYHDAKRQSYVVLPVIPREGTGELKFAANSVKF